ncbi:MAG: TetR/AcrR family transcriptional regulator [Caulobacteraceae bacterium]
MIAAAVNCLHRNGYGLTTIGGVAEAAGVSRGALTHHFPSKVDLMLAVVTSVAGKNVVEYGQLFDSLAPIDAVRKIPQAVWEISSRPQTVAIIEILMATRSDPALAQKLQAIQMELEQMTMDLLTNRLHAAGLTPPVNSKAIFTLMVAAIRGLAIENVSMGRSQLIDDAIRLLTDLFSLLVEPPCPRH